MYVLKKVKISYLYNKQRVVNDQLSFFSVAVEIVVGVGTSSCGHRTCYRLAVNRGFEASSCTGIL